MSVTDAGGHPWISYQDSSRVDSQNGLKMAFYDPNRTNPVDSGAYKDENNVDITGR
ncbi:MAG: hypothetical protein LBD58_09020 [Treponema sp.]|jgi:hypothetical protein|nr:hypothetical protein [Treponema sp.]